MKAHQRQRQVLLRQRESEIRSLEDHNKKNPPEKKRRLAFGGGGDIPEDTGSYVTQEIVKVRKDAKAREEAKTAGPKAGAVGKALKQHDKRKQAIERKRWVGRPGSAKDGKQETKHDDGGQTPVLLPAAVAWNNFMWVSPAQGHRDTLMRLGFDLLSSWPRYAKRCLEAKSAATHGIVVLDTLHSETLSSDPRALVARIFGGFVTTSAWLSVALKATQIRDTFPQGVQFKGLCFQTITVCLSPAVKDKHKEVYEAFRVLAEACGPNFKMEDKVHKVNKAVQSYTARHGIRSRPWLKHVVIASNEADRQNFIGCTEPRVVQTLESFLTTHSPIQREAACPGWRSSKQ